MLKYGENNCFLDQKFIYIFENIGDLGTEKSRPGECFEDTRVHALIKQVPRSDLQYTATWKEMMIVGQWPGHQLGIGGISTFRSFENMFSTIVCQISDNMCLLERGIYVHELDIQTYSPWDSMRKYD